MFQWRIFNSTAVEPVTSIQPINSSKSILHGQNMLQNTAFNVRADPLCEAPTPIAAGPGQILSIADKIDMMIASNVSEYSDYVVLTDYIDSKITSDHGSVVSLSELETESEDAWSVESSIKQKSATSQDDHDALSNASSTSLV